MHPRRTLQTLAAAGSLAGLWAAAALAQAPAAPGLDQRQDLRLAIRSVGAAEAGMLHGVELDGEAASEQAARDYGFRSMHQVLDVDCASRRERVRRMVVFREHGLNGAGVERRPPGQWAAPSPDAYLADVIAAVCRGAPSRQTEPPRLRATAAAPALAAADKAAPVVQPRPRLAAAAPTPAPVRRDEAPPLAAVAIVSAPLPAPRPAPAPAAVVGRAWVAQVGASASPEAARRELGRLGGLIGQGLEGRIEQATVDGRLYFRATVAGFASREAANGFCDRIQRTGAACWAR